MPHSNKIVHLHNQLILTMLPFFFLFGCSSTLKLNSAWEKQTTQIDGHQEDWEGRLTFVEKKNVSIGVRNDHEFLYICLVSSDKVLQRQMLSMGFILWFDADGGKDKTFGIRFPTGMLDNGMFMPRNRRAERTPEEIRDRFAQQTELEILGPQKDESKRFAINEVPGIEVKIGKPADVLVYEIKVPLKRTKTYPYAIENREGAKVGVGFETAKFDFEKLRAERGFGGRPAGGFGGGRGGGRGAFGGGRGRLGVSPSVPEQFKFWVAVRLGSGSNNAAFIQDQNQSLSTF